MKFATDPEARSFEDLCLHAQILCDDLATLEATVTNDWAANPVHLLANCVSRLAAQVAELTQRLALTTIAAPHDCGMCDAPLTFVGWEGKYKTWLCGSCGWWHIARHCCHTEED